MGSTKKGSVHSILDTTSYLLVFLAAMSFMLNSIMLLPTPMGIITSPSMRPIMDAGDVVFIHPAAIEEIKVGDIIAFYALVGGGERTMIHRVVKILIYPGKTYLITKGDNNLVTDQAVGIAPVSSQNLIGKVYCLDGYPLRIPLIGLFIIWAKNQSIWLTQNKIWCFWAPLLAVLFIFGPYLSPTGLGRFDLRKSLRVKIPAGTLFTYSLVAFIAISAFTLYFRTEVYTLSLRVACLKEFREPRYIVFGSMIYGEAKNNTITVSGAPLFPVKTFVFITENASSLVTPIPHVARIEPDTLNDLILQASIPPRGEVDPGLYGGMVYIFSDTILLFLPDELIFAVLSMVPNPWIAVILLDTLVALLLASLLASIAIAINWVSRQILYTLVWGDRLETRPLHTLRIKMHNFRGKVGALLQEIAGKVGRGYSVMREEVELKRVLKLACLATVPATILLLINNIIVPVITLGLVLGLLVRTQRMRRSELVFSAALANLCVSIVFVVTRAAVFLYSGVNPYWCVVSAGFVGNISYVITLPIAIGMTLLTVFGFERTRVWYLEQQTSNWQFMKPVEVPIEKVIKIPSIEEFEVLKRRRLTISEIKGISVGAVSVLRAKVKGALARVHKKLGDLLKALRLEAYVTALALKMKETKLIERERPLLMLISGFRFKIRSGKGRFNLLLENAGWMFRLLGHKVIRTVKGEGGW